MFAVDAGSTMSVGKTMEKYGLHAKGVRAGGFDLLPATLDAIAKGDLDFTIDQQPYLQGFYTVMEMAMFKFSGGLTGPADINTGLKFVTKASVEPYRSTRSRYEGNSSAEAVIPRSGPIGAA
jgi:simple sugar transport system substrate-binding protein